MEPSKRRSILSGYLRVLLLWNPLVCVAITIVSPWGGRPVRTAYLSLLIATVTASFSFLVSALWQTVERWNAQRRGRAIPQHGSSWHFAQALCSMPVGLFLAFEVTGALVRLVGGKWHRPDFFGYRLGLLFL
jgi:hypothetical protein